MSGNLSGRTALAARFVTGETICVDGGMARTTDLHAGAD